MNEETQPDNWSQLSEEERALILRRLEGKAERAGSRGIPKRPDLNSAPLSFSQEQLWFLDQFEPGVTAYIRPWALRISGTLNVRFLEQSLNEIVHRHEALRTIFVSSEGTSHQRILPYQEFTLPITDISNELDKEALAVQIATDDARLPFDLTRDPMLRSRLIRLDPDDHVLMLTTHHIAFDGWSERVMFHELSALYQHFRTGTSASLPVVKVQFPDYAHWQRKYLTGKEYDRLVTFWQKELKDAPPLLKLNTDYVRPKTRSYAGASIETNLSNELTTSIKRLSRDEGVTLFMALLAAYKVVLHRNSSEIDIVVGGTLSGRNNIESQQAIGFFVNTLVLRTNLGDDLTFRVLLERVRSTMLNALDHQELPFEKLVEILNPRRDLSYTPVVQVTLQLRNLPARGAGIPDLDIKEFNHGTQEALFDLSLRVEDLHDGLSCKLVYNQDLFSKDSAQRYLQHFQDVLQTVAAEPEIRLSEIPWSDAKTTPKREFATPIVDPEIQDRSNLTGTQLMIWAGQKFRPESLQYNLPYKFSIHGHIDRSRFELSLQDLIDMSDALRTIIVEEDGIPQRIVRKHMPSKMGFEDFSENPDPLSAAENWIGQVSKRAFNLSERLFDTTLIRLADDHWIWFLHVHQIIVDNIGVQLIFDRLQEIYKFVLEGKELREINYPQYEDYVSFEKKNNLTPQHRAAEAYWTKKLSSPSEPLLFFGDRKLKETPHVKRRTFEIEKEICQKLYELAEKEPFFIHSVDVTLTNIFASLVYAFLYRITTSRELSIGIYFHNRRTPQFQQTVGLFMEILPLRISIDDGETFSTLINKVNREASITIQHRNVAIGNPIHHPNYEITLNFQTVKANSFLGFPTEFLRIHNGQEEDTLGIQIRDYGASGEFILDFDFHRDVFSEADQQRCIQYFNRLLKSVLDNPDQSLDDINMLSEEEREWLLYKINQTQKPLSKDTTVVQLIEKQVEESPENIAVVHEDSTLTYSQLNSRANQLAHKLHNLGLKPEDQVGILVKRSVEMVVGILGILKAGCVYLPLDPNHPADRLNYILEDSGVAAVVTQIDLLDRLPNKKIHQLILDQWEDFIEQSESNPLSGAGPKHAAYRIYTSGSTGDPKGVTIEHHSLLNFTQWAVEDWEISHNDRVLQFTSISWDTHIEEIFPTLCSGGTLVLRTDTMIDTFQSFIEIIQREEISVINLPTPYWHELTDAIEYQKLSVPPCIRLVIIGGDRANHHRVSSWLKKLPPHVRLVNTYGLTECACIVTQIDLTKEFNPDREVVPIGKPINNAQIYVLDQQMKPVPIGLPGELWIGGAGLARGYINKPQLTKEVFQQNPFAKTTQNRLYRSGDIVRHLPDGNLEMLGRMDNQIKIRGYRVELGEIEVVLSKHKAIKEVLVVVRSNELHPDPNLAGEKRLIAYYLTEPHIKRDDLEDEFRNFLRDKLPDYMIPTYFIKLEAFPLTAHGKVDRQALPPPDKRDIERAYAYIAPRNSMESQLVDIWQQVLDVQPIGVKDNFFDLGGHSILAVRLFSLIEKEIGIKLPLMTLFDTPTIENQSKSLLSRQEKTDPTWVVDVQTGGSKPPFFCVSPSVIDVITYRELSRNMGVDQPFYALYSESMGSWREGVEHLETIAKQSIEKIREIDQRGPYFIGGYSAGGIVALEIAKQLRKQGFHVGLLVLFDTFGPNYPRLLPGITPRIFGALRVLRRIQSYWWKFWLLDWKGKLQYLRFPRIHTWVRDRYGEVRAPARPPAEKGAYFLTPARRKYKPGNYEGKVLLVRAKKGFFGIRQDPKMGWSEVFSRDFEVCMVPGDHEAMLFGPRSKYVADKLTSYLASSNKSIQD